MHKTQDACDSGKRRKHTSEAIERGFKHKLEHYSRGSCRSVVVDQKLQHALEPFRTSRRAIMSRRPVTDAMPSSGFDSLA